MATKKAAKKAAKKTREEGRKEGRKEEVIAATNNKATLRGTHQASPFSVYWRKN